MSHLSRTFQWMIALLSLSSILAFSTVPCPLRARGDHLYVSTRVEVSIASVGKLESPLDGASSSSSATIDWDWKALADSVFEEDRRPVILFDGVCNLCNGGVNFAMDHDESAKFRFASLQSRVGKSLLLDIGRKPGDTSNIILLTGPRKAYFSSDAVARICSQLDTPTLRIFGELGKLTPSFLREPIYKIVSENRYQFGEYDSCRIDFDGTLSSRFVQDPDDEEHRLV